MLDKKKISRHIVAALTVYAFGNSYLHGVSWVQDHSNNDFFAWGTAAIPELILISALLRGKFDLKAVVGAVASIGWTFWVNGASAANGISGMVVALAPPLAAVLCAWFLEAEEPPAKPKPRTRPRPKPEDRKPRKPSMVDTGILWATQTYHPGDWPTMLDVKERFPNYSDTTARKIVRARPVTTQS